MSSTLYHLADSIDPEVAKQLTDTHATLLLLDVPDGTLLGVDQHTFGVGPKFKGVKMIPPGAHFMCSRAVSHQNLSVGPATGFFVHVAAQQVLVYRWDHETETLVPLQDEDEMQRYIAGVRRYDFDAGLAPYNLPAHQAWVQISDLITPALIHQLSPPSGIISITAEGQDAGLSEPRTAAEHRLVAQLNQARGPQPVSQHMQHDAVAQLSEEHQGMESSTDMAVDCPQHDGTAEVGGPERGMALQGTHQPVQPEAADAAAGRCRYTRLPRFVKQAGATAAELTALNMDKSALLQQVLSLNFKGRLEGFIGELQYAFIAFVYGTSLDGYAQWKAILLLLLGCEHAALHTWQPQFAKVLHLIQCQLSIGLGKQGDMAASSGSMPFGESLVEELLPDSFLRRMFGSFFNMLQENSTQVGLELFQAATQLKDLLHTQLGWDYDLQVLGVGQGVGDEEGDEDGPVVVEDPHDLVRL